MRIFYSRIANDATTPSQTHDRCSREKVHSRKKGQVNPGESMSTECLLSGLGRARGNIVVGKTRTHYKILERIGQ